jgi:hypothetical protein
VPGYLRRRFADIESPPRSQRHAIVRCVRKAALSPGRETSVLCWFLAVTRHSPIPIARKIRQLRETHGPRDALRLSSLRDRRSRLQQERGAFLPHLLTGRARRFPPPRTRAAHCPFAGSWDSQSPTLISEDQRSSDESPETFRVSEITKGAKRLSNDFDAASPRFRSFVGPLPHAYRRSVPVNRSLVFDSLADARLNQCSIDDATDMGKLSKHPPEESS